MADQLGHPTFASITPPLVGRAREQAALRAALENALAGHGTLVLIGGEAGIGKTALAEWVCAEAAAQGALVLVGRCYDLSETPPYGPWTEALSRAPAGGDLPTLPAAVLPPEREGEALTSRDAVFRRVHAFIAALAARRPLVLLLEDLHWADPASLDLLRALARGMAALPILQMATYRADELPRRHPLYQLLPALVRETRAARFDLRPLEATAVGALVAARYALPPNDATRLVAYLDRRAEGNPFFAGELLRALAEARALRPAAAGAPDWILDDPEAVAIPALLRQVIDGRLARLGEAARALLAVAAVIGQDVPVDLWATVAEAGEDTLLDVMERAAAARVLDLTTEGACFAHALIREALYEGVPPLRRRALHRRLGERLAALPAPDPDAVAAHFRQADDPRAVAWLIRAADRAEAAWALLSAAERVQAALALLDAAGADAGTRAQLLARLARVRRSAAPDESRRYLDRAAQLAAAVGDHTLVAAARFDQGHLRRLAGEPRRGLAELEAHLPALEALPPAERARLLALGILGGEPGSDGHAGALVYWLAHVGRAAEARARGEALVVRGAVPTARVLVGLARAYALLGQPEEAHRALADARAAFVAAGIPQGISPPLAHEVQLVAVPYRADRPSEWQHLAEEATRTERVWAVADTGIPPRWVRLPLLWLAGRWAEARPLALQLHMARRVRGGHLGPTVILGLLSRAQGDRDLAGRLVSDALPAGPATEPGDAQFLEVTALQRLAVGLALDAGDLPAARAWLETHDRWLAWGGVVLGQAAGLLGWAAYSRSAGDHASARAHAERALAHASAPRQPLALLAAHRLIGELATSAGQTTEAQAHLDTALALATACAAPYERARTLLALAELRAAAGRRADAQGLLAEARANLEALEARPALTRAAALAERLASSPVPAAPAALPFGLTAREMEVLRLLAAGLTDAQIADRLFVSPHTIGTHLRAIYGKLGVSSRSAATAFAIDHGLR